MSVPTGDPKLRLSPIDTLLRYCKSWCPSMSLPQTDIPGRLESQLTKRGIRPTRQRRTILRVIETVKVHPDASRILRSARRLDVCVNRSTVYRTLSLLKKHGFVAELDPMHVEGEPHSHEHACQDHIHMACLRCGKITEFESELFETVNATTRSRL